MTQDEAIETVRRAAYPVAGDRGVPWTILMRAITVCVILLLRRNNLTA